MANFAALEARTAVAISRHLNNAAALLLDTGAQVPVVFDNDSQAGLGGAFETSQPSALGTTADLHGLAHGSRLMLPRAPGVPGLDQWVVVGIQPDGTGMTRLLLERAP